MRKLKKSILTMSLVMGLLVTCVPSAFAADVVGGWDEETGYYVNAEAYAKATAGNLLRADSKPVHIMVQKKRV